MKHVLTFEEFEFEEFDELTEEFNDSEYVFSVNEGLSDTIDKLQKAISQKSVCTIYYKGEKKGQVLDGFRTIEPYALGVSLAGNMVVRAWMIKGVSKTGKTNRKLVPGWRLYRLNRIVSCNVTHDKFTKPHKGYNPKDLGMTQITAKAKF